MGVVFDEFDDAFIEQVQNKFELITFLQFFKYFNVHLLVLIVQLENLVAYDRGTLRQYIQWRHLTVRVVALDGLLVDVIA